MHRTILLRHLANSSLVGTSHEFRQARVRLGRKADNDVVFDPTLDRVVSGHHCEVLCEGDALFVADPGSTNGTFVNGRRVQGKMPVTDRDQVTLGDQGPAFAVSFVAAAGDAPRTIMGSVLDTLPEMAFAPAGVGLLDAQPFAADAETEVHSRTEVQARRPGGGGGSSDNGGGGGRRDRANGSGRDRATVAPPPPRPAPAPEASPRGPAAAKAAAGAVTAAPPAPPSTGRVPTDRGPSRSSQGQRPPQKTSIGMNTLMVELNKATRRERRRMLALIAPTAAALLLAGGLAWYYGRGAPIAQGTTEVVRTPIISTDRTTSAGGAPGTLTTPNPVSNPGTQVPLTTGPANPPGPVAVPGSAAPPGPAVSPAAVPTSPPPPAPVGPRPWADVLAERKEAVYLVLIQSTGKEDSPQGTAWSVAPGLLATNAHVAELFAELGPNDILVCRSSTNPPVDLKIDSVRIHPGYATFARLQAAYYPVDPNTGKPLNFPATYDAALMTVAAADRPKQVKPLELADAAALAKLKEASEVAYIGYPQEGSVEGGVNVRMPEPHRFLGTLSRKTDVFLSAANEARSNFLQYTLIVQGGASGSPVFDRDGKVVGLIAGNDVIGRGKEGRILVSGKSFGPRADVVREMLDGSADAKLVPVAAEWRAAFRERYDRADKAKKYDDLPGFRAELAFGITAKAKAERNEKWALNKLRRMRSWTVDSSDLSAAAGGAKPFVTDPLPETGYYCIVLTTDNPDVTPRLALPEADEVLTQTKSAYDLKQVRTTLGDGTPHVASYPVRQDAGSTFRFAVSADAAVPGASATLTATLYRAVATE